MLLYLGWCLWDAPHHPSVLPLSTMRPALNWTEEPALVSKKRNHKRIRTARVPGGVLRSHVPDSWEAKCFWEDIEAILADMESARLEDPAISGSNVLPKWLQLQRSFLKCNEQELVAELGDGVKLTPVYPKRLVQEGFIAAQGAMLPAYHGTAGVNIPSISREGLLLPGHGGVKIRNGNAHGLGIYTARLGAAWLSKGFCNSSKLFVCAVKDSEQKEEASQPSWASVGQIRPGQVVLRMSGTVLHVGDAMVVKSQRHVAPLFIADLPSQDKEPRMNFKMVEGMLHLLHMSTDERNLRRREEQRYCSRLKRRRSMKYESLFHDGIGVVRAC